VDSSPEIVEVIEHQTVPEAEPDISIPELMFIRCRWKAEVHKYRLDLVLS